MNKSLAASLLGRLPATVRALPELMPLRYFCGGAKSLRATYVASLRNNTRALQMVRRILDAAEAASIDLLPLKGALWAEVLYGDVALRPMVDVDLAVRPSQLDAAKGLVEAHGFRRLFPDGPRFTGHHAHDVAFISPEAGVLELHYRLFHELSVDAQVERLFDRVEHADYLGRVRPIPGWSDQLFLAAVHAATHAFGDSPMWLFDVALLIERGTSVDDAAAEAVHRSARIPFAQAMRYVELCLGVPAATVGGLGDWLRARAIDELVGADRVGAKLPQWRSLLARAFLTEHIADVGLTLGRKSALTLREWRR